MIDYTVQTVKTDNFEMDYIKFGTGVRPLVLLPGMSLKNITWQLLKEVLTKIKRAGYACI